MRVKTVANVTLSVAFLWALAAWTSAPSAARADEENRGRCEYTCVLAKRHCADACDERGQACLDRCSEQARTCERICGEFIPSGGGAERAAEERGDERE